MDTMTQYQLSEPDLFVIARARELADSINHNREREWSRREDQNDAFASCLGAAGINLGQLLRIITKLTTAPQTTTELIDELYADAKNANDVADGLA